MNHETQNRKYYQDTFDEIHASDHLLRKVESMKQTKNNKIIRRAFKLGYAAAAVAVILISSNAIIYAATGNTWIEKVFVTLNGQKQEVEMTKSVDTDGNEVLTATFDVDDTEDITIVHNEDTAPSSQTSTDTPDIPASIITEGDKVYLKAAEKLIDITEDIKDGSCKGVFEQEETTYQYEITGTPEVYDISISTLE